MKWASFFQGGSRDGSDATHDAHTIYAEHEILWIHNETPGGKCGFHASHDAALYEQNEHKLPACGMHGASSEECDGTCAIYEPIF